MTPTVDIIEHIKGAVTNDQVFGPATQHSGITVIPASSVKGGGGAGAGAGTNEGEASGEGDGAGFGVIARPAGALIITDDKVRWKPTLDLNRIIAGGQLVGVSYFVASWLIERSRAKSLVKIAKLAKGAAHVEPGSIGREELRRGIVSGDLIAIMTMSADAYGAAHIPGSHQMQSVTDAKHRFGTDARIVVYCTDPTCRASLAAYHQLTDSGFTNVRHYRGGLSDWTEAGYSVETLSA